MFSIAFIETIDILSFNFMGRDFPASDAILFACAHISSFIKFLKHMSFANEKIGRINKTVAVIACIGLIIR
ncbi:hypothetical protein OkiPb00422_44830 [Escherichia coli]